MPNRVLRGSFVTSDLIDALTAEEERMFFRLIAVVDDFGLMDARPVILRSSCFPLKGDVGVADVARWIAALASKGLVDLYEVEGKPYVAVRKWQERRRSHPKYPQPSAGTPVVELQTIKALPSPKRAAPRPAPQQDEFTAFWRAYPRKEKKPDAMKAWLQESPPLDAVIADVERRRSTPDWLKDGGKFIPHPATYLRQRRWEDEVPREDVRLPPGIKVMA